MMIKIILLEIKLLDQFYVRNYCYGKTTAMKQMDFALLGWMKYCNRKLRWMKNPIGNFELGNYAYGNN